MKNPVRPRSRSEKLACSNRQARLMGEVPIFKMGTLQYLASLTNEMQDTIFLDSFESKKIERENRKKLFSLKRENKDKKGKKQKNKRKNKKRK